MDRPTYTDKLTFRAPPVLFDRINADAAKRGMSPSEFVRQAVHRELERAA